MADILFVSKALTPPWNDSGKNLVRDLARGLSRHRATVMVPRGGALELGAHVRCAELYPGQTDFAPALLDQARVLAYLLAARGHALFHFFFAPNPRSCRAGWLATRARRVRSVHTISSAPRDPAQIVPLLFAERNVVLSRHTERRLLEAGLAADRVRRIAPAIEPLTPKDAGQRAALRRELGFADGPLLVYPGDLEFGEGAERMIEVARASRRELTLVLACRTKTERARRVQADLRERVERAGLAARVQFVGETTRIHDYLACADIVALPSTDLYAKMDYPLVLLEAMSLARCVIVAAGSAAAELAETGGALALAPEAEALCNTIEQLLDDEHERARIGDQGRAAVLDAFTYPRMAEAYERLYDELG